MRNARGIVAREMAAASAVGPLMCMVLKLSGKLVSARRRSPPSCSVAGSCGFMSLLVPTLASTPEEGTSRLPPEHALSVRPATRRAPARRRIFTKSDSNLVCRLRAVSRPPPARTHRSGLRHRGQQLPRVFVPRVGEHVCGVTRLDDGTGVHDHQSVGEVLD